MLVLAIVIIVGVVGLLGWACERAGWSARSRSRWQWTILAVVAMLATRWTLQGSGTNVYLAGVWAGVARFCVLALGFSLYQHQSRRNGP